MELALLVGAAFFLFGGSSSSSGGGYTAPQKQPTPSGTAPKTTGGGDWGTQLGALLAGLGSGVGKVVDAAQDDSK